MAKKVTTKSRPKPTRIASAGIAPHVRTMSNGKPRPKRRSK